MINRIEVSITDRCNLNCAYCSHYASLCKDTKDMSVATFGGDIAVLGELTKDGRELGTLGILGGEPFLHQQLYDMLYIARKYLPFSRVRLTTNGTTILQLTGQQLAMLRRFDIEILISKYAQGIDYIGIERVLRANNITYKFTQNGHYTEFYKYSMDEKGEQTPEESHKNCTLWCGTYTCHELRNGELYPCSQIARSHILNDKFGTNFKETMVDSITIRTHTLKEIEEFLKKPVLFCRYCKTKEWPMNNMGKYKPSQCNKEEFI